MTYKFSLFLLFLFAASQIIGQNNGKPIRGKVSFITSKNVYVKFENTDAIAIGDTLQLASNNSPCLVVNNKSSSSCVCVAINGCEIEKGAEIYYTNKKESPSALEKEGPLIVETPDIPTDTIAQEEASKYTEQIRGRISVSAYNNIASDRDDRHRFMSRLSLNADHIKNSKFSFETYMNYRQIVPTGTAKFDPKTSYFNVFNLAVKYDVDPTFSIVLGRKINPKISSLGAIDGLQVEKSFGNNYVGAMVGSRPDILNYSINTNLLEYGGYFGRYSRNKNFYSTTTLGFIEQRNSGQIDRRYAYFQHSSTIARKLSLFSSLELDLYSSVNGVTSNEVRLPNLFLSGTYRVNKKISLMVSYDSRKRILYYETFQTEIERLLNDDLARQGIRARINVRPVKYVSAGFSYGQRFQSDNQNQSDNLHGYVRWANIPAIGGRISVTYNRNSSNYLTSNIYAGRYSRSIIKQKLDADFYYRLADYTFVNSETARRQQYYGTRLSLSITRKLALSTAIEYSTFNGENNYRIYTRIIQRFYSKKK